MQINDIKSKTLHSPVQPDQIKSKIQYIQQKLKLSNDEILYAQDSLGDDINYNVAYLNKVEKVLNIKNYYDLEYVKRNNNIVTLKQLIQNNLINKKQIISSLIEVRYQTIDILLVLQKLQHIVGLPVNFDLRINQFSTFNYILVENHFSMQDIVRFIQFSKIYDQYKFQFNEEEEVIADELNKNEIDIQYLNCVFLIQNEEIPTFQKFWQVIGQQYQLILQDLNFQLPKQFSFNQLIFCINKQQQKLNDYFDQQLVAEQYGQQICIISTRQNMDGYDSFIKYSSDQQTYDRNNTLSNSIQESFQVNQQDDFINENLQQAQNQYEQQITELQNMLNIQDIEQQYAKFKYQNDKQIQFQYLQRLQNVLDIQNKFTQMITLQQQLNEVLQQNQYNKADFIQNYYNFRQNTINIIILCIQFKQLIGCPVQPDYIIANTSENLVNQSYSKILVNLLKVVKFPIGDQYIQEYVEQITQSKFFNCFRVLTGQQLQQNEHYLNFPILVDYLLYQQCQQLRLELNTTINLQNFDLEDIQNYILSEKHNFEKIKRLQDRIVSQQVYLCKVPISNNQIDCFKNDEFEYQYKKMEIMDNNNLHHQQTQAQQKTQITQNQQSKKKNLTSSSNEFTQGAHTPELFEKCYYFGVERVQMKGNMEYKFKVPEKQMVKQSMSQNQLNILSLQYQTTFTKKQLIVKSESSIDELKFSISQPQQNQQNHNIFKNENSKQNDNSSQELRDSIVHVQQKPIQ